MLLQITYQDKATQTENENTMEEILKVITTLCIKVDSMDNEIQKLKTNEDNLKSKASQQHDYKNAELRRSEDGKNPELKGDDGKLLKTHNICLNIAAEVSATRKYLIMRSDRRFVADIISNLPCNVLDEILGCLPWKDAVKTTKSIIYQVLLLHKGPILKFTLHGRNVKGYPDINHWILFLSKKNVEEFSLHICTFIKYHLPSQFFTFQQLRHLELDTFLFYPPPDFKGFEKLINLDFQSVIFDLAIFKNLISKCPLLERLRLYWCTHFDILEIDVANLKWFEFYGTSKFICFKNAPMLRNINMYLDPQVLTDPSPVCSNVTKFFHYMPSLQELKLSGSTLEYLIMGGIPESPPTALNNVKFLCILDMCLRNVKEFSSVVYLITSCPKLQELRIECEIVCDDVEPDIQLLRAQSISCGVMKILQRVEMQGFTGFEMEMEFMKIILASAPVLEEIFV
ncbi:hypothetical protein MTR67_036468 [Solanum verrucosum]|uniref:At1g61320/AtMIF1 LRR domain-containing protein n=1 Tax=Solanum verrucosum TaxID=315347 RepID=A0AAF0ZMI0_SOLVR|nr:hypothetical protein MTR67_036468 [Solanum verrucosum]